VATHVKVIAGLFIVIAVLLVLGALLIPLGFGLLASFISASGEKDAGTAATVLGLTGLFVSVLFSFIAIPFGICAYGLLKLRRWGRIMGIVMAAVALINIPFGTLIGIYALIVLFQNDTEKLFAATPA
jgi:hypothetical protein